MDDALQRLGGEVIRLRGPNDEDISTSPSALGLARRIRDCVCCPSSMGCWSGTTVIITRFLTEQQLPSPGPR